MTGEESLQQVSMRAKRLQLNPEPLRLLTETCVERIIEHASLEKPDVMVIDSIQTIHTEELTSAPNIIFRTPIINQYNYGKQIFGHP